jgi:hypothetical protein
MQNNRPPTCTADAATAACSAASAARDAALLAAAEYAAARCEASTAAPLARIAICARSRKLGSEGSEGMAASSACVTAFAGGSTWRVKTTKAAARERSSFVCLSHWTRDGLVCERAFAECNTAQDKAPGSFAVMNCRALLLLNGSRTRAREQLLDVHV